MKTHATRREMNEAIPAPSAPMPKIYMKIAFPVTLIRFMMMETSIVILLFPIDLKSAFALLRSARNGYERTIGVK